MHDLGVDFAIEQGHESEVDPLERLCLSLWLWVSFEDQTRASKEVRDNANHELVFVYNC